MESASDSETLDMYLLRHLLESEGDVSESVRTTTGSDPGAPPDTLEERLADSALHQPYLTRKAITLAQEMTVSMDIEKRVRGHYAGRETFYSSETDLPPAKAHRCLRDGTQSADLYRFRMSPIKFSEQPFTLANRHRTSSNRSAASSKFSSNRSTGPPSLSSSSIEDCLEDAENARKVLESVGIVVDQEKDQDQGQVKDQDQLSVSSERTSSSSAAETDELEVKSSQINLLLDDIKHLCRVQEDVTSRGKEVQPRSISTSSLFSSNASFSTSTESQITSPPRLLSPESKAEVRRSVQVLVNYTETQRALGATGVVTNSNSSAVQRLHSLNEDLEKEVSQLAHKSEDFLGEAFSTRYLDRLIRDAQDLAKMHDVSVKTLRSSVCNAITGTSDDGVETEEVEVDDQQ